MTTTSFNIGDRPKLTYIAKVDGTPTDATVILTVTRPDGTTLTPTPDHTGLGTYTANIDVDMDGLWTFLWSATGAVTDTEDGTFRVLARAGATVYATVGELREWFGDDGERLSSPQLARALAATSRAIDRYCFRRFWRDNSATTRLFRADEPDFVWIDDLWSTSGLIVATDPGANGLFSETWTQTTYQLEPLNSAADAGGDSAFAWWQIAAVSTMSFPYAQRRAGVRVTAKWGWSAVPDQVSEATLLKAASLFKRRDAPFGWAAVGDVGVVRIGRNDVDVVDLLSPFRKTRPRTLTYRPQVNSIFHGGLQ